MDNPLAIAGGAGSSASQRGQETTRIAADLMELAAQRKIVVWAHIALDFPGKGSIAVHVDGLLLVAARPAPSAGLVVV